MTPDERPQAPTGPYALSDPGVADPARLDPRRPLAAELAMRVADGSRCRPSAT